MPDEKELAKRVFGAYAANYTKSDVHARGSDLPLFVQLAALTGSEEILDVATGPGHVALAMAPNAARVTGLDLTPEMLDEARRNAAAKGITNMAYVEGDAEHLPFADAQFDLVTCRVSAHHFPDPAAFCREAARVLRPGGRLMVLDNIAPEDEELDLFINTVEKLRDPSHVREWRLSEWERFFCQAGLSFAVAHTGTMPLDREAWMERTGVQEPGASDIRRRFAAASPEAAATFEITPTHFSLLKAIVIGSKNQ